MKYHNKKIEYNGEVFDSKKEYRRWLELLMAQGDGEITDLRRQVKFTLIPAQRDMDGKLIERECSYKADFVYKDGKLTVVEDVKGVKTKDYIIKRKLMLFRFGIRIREI